MLESLDDEINFFPFLNPHKKIILRYLKTMKISELMPITSVYKAKSPPTLIEILELSRSFQEKLARLKCSVAVVEQERKLNEEQ